MSELANLPPWTHQPFVGESAFAHKAGVHVSAVQKDSKPMNIFRRRWWATNEGY